jgi:phospholipid/cholesterol/gamma-HCH transport system permease protein
MAIATRRLPARASIATSALTRMLTGSFVEFGTWLIFAGRVLKGAVTEVVIGRRFGKVLLRSMSDIVAGPGFLAAGAGMVFVLAGMSLSIGAEIGLQAFKGLQALGAQSFTGLVASFVNVREIGPIIFAIALAAQVGAGFTAELGAMRISDEIDALEVMGIPPITYLVCTRVVAMVLVFLPLYLVGLFISFFAARFVTITILHGLSPGIYDYYFHLFLPPIDIFYSVIKVLIFTVIITLIHCYYGYYASGGPVGVGLAVGKAIRVTIVVIVLVNLMLSFLFWGHGATVSITG